MVILLIPKNMITKKKWLDDLIKQLKALTKKNQNIILGGDFNIIPAAEDVYNPKSFEDDALFRLEIRKKLREMINLGFNDVYRHFNETKEGYTFNFVNPLISNNSIFSAFLAIDFNGFSKKFSRSSPTQNIKSASCNIFACEGFKANP